MLESRHLQELPNFFTSFTKWHFFTFPQGGADQGISRFFFPNTLNKARTYYALSILLLQTTGGKQDNASFLPTISYSLLSHSHEALEKIYDKNSTQTS